MYKPFAQPLNTFQHQHIERELRQQFDLRQVAKYAGHGLLEFQGSSSVYKALLE